MARPKNVVVSLGSTIYSVSPKNLRAYLSARMNGTNVHLSGKSLGQVQITGLEAVSAADAEKLLKEMGPEAGEGVDLSSLPTIE